jgi:hypothetical protein
VVGPVRAAIPRGHIWGDPHSTRSSDTAVMRMYGIPCGTSRHRTSARETQLPPGESAARRRDCGFAGAPLRALPGRAGGAPPAPRRGSTDRRGPASLSERHGKLPRALDVGTGSFVRSAGGSDVVCEGLYVIRKRADGRPDGAQRCCGWGDLRGTGRRPHCVEVRLKPIDLCCVLRPVLLTHPWRRRRPAARLTRSP